MYGREAFMARILTPPICGDFSRKIIARVTGTTGWHEAYKKCKKRKSIQYAEVHKTRGGESFGMCKNFSTGELHLEKGGE